MPISSLKHRFHPHYLSRNTLLSVAATLSIAACSACGAEDESTEVLEGHAAPASAALQAPGQVQVVDVTATGSGCPAGSFSSSVEDDGSRVKLSFRRFFGEVSGRTKVSKNCTVSINVRSTEGFQYAASAVANSIQSTGLFKYAGVLQWDGVTDTKTLSDTAGGTVARSYYTYDYWSPCAPEAKLQVSTELSAENKGTEFELLDQGITFRSRRCAGAPVDPVAPAPTELSISNVRAIGSGCPSDATKVAVAPDGKAVSLSFDKLNTSRPVSCSVTLDVLAPAGQSYALSGFTATGKATLGIGAKARVLLSTAFTGLGTDKTKERVSELDGEVDGAIKLEESFSEEQLNFSPCDGTRPSLRLYVRPTLPSNTQGSLHIDTIDALTFALRKCE